MSLDTVNIKLPDFYYYDISYSLELLLANEKTRFEDSAPYGFNLNFGTGIVKLVHCPACV